MSVIIVDYGMGNVASIGNMLAKSGFDARLTDDPDEVYSAQTLILPGVGAFDEAVVTLQSRGLGEAIVRRHHETDGLLLGVCLGMQLLGDASEEGRLPGLGIISGRCRRFPNDTTGELRVPHMGWARVDPTGTGDALPSLGGGARFYFVHSFYFEAADAHSVIGMTDYGVHFASAIRSGNSFGVQFHPEKSHRYGAALLRDFMSLREGVQA